jgi:hypothetical protein
VKTKPKIPAPKRCQSILVAGAIVLSLPSLSMGVVLVSQNPVSGGGVSRWSQLWQDPGPGGNDLDSDAICWEDFTLNAATSITHIEWWGRGACELGFQIEFWPQDPGTIAYQPLAVFDRAPGPSLVTPQARFIVTPSDYTTNSGPGGLTHFSLDLAAPVTLAANNSANPRWFIGIIGLTHQSFVTWNWSQGLGGSTRTFQWLRADGNTFRSLSEGRALVLADVSPGDSPRLTISKSVTNTVVISWPTNAPGYVLQQNGFCGTTNWVNVTNPIVVVGQQHEALLSAPTGNCFFRLIHP